jgi:hypothetical protein
MTSIEWKQLMRPERLRLAAVLRLLHAVNRRAAMQLARDVRPAFA